MTRIATLTASALVVLSSFLNAEVQLSRMFNHHMIFQQNKEIRIWGTAAAGEKVSVEFNGKKGEATASDDGKWRVNLPAMKHEPGKTHKLIVKGTNTIDLEDILLGEVWICSGQSNMEWAVKQSHNPREEIPAAKYPEIRLFDVQRHVASDTPQDDPRSLWRGCRPTTVPSFSAVGYYFGRELHKELKIPIGLIGTNWGGTRIEPWTPPVGFDAVPKIQDRRNKHGATRIYNGMAAALTPFNVRGAIWYQGESNAGDGLLYDHLKEGLVKGWRSVFENEDLSFYWVQLANFQGASDNPAGGGWGPVREGQRRALRLPKTGMAVTIDIGAARDIHPKNKQDVGKRLALWALAKNYGKKIVYSGPLYKGMKKEGNKIRINFDHVGTGLMTGSKAGLDPAKETQDELKRFAIQDQEGAWHWAKAKIDGESVLVWHDQVKDPQHVRFGYESNPVGINLYNKEGLPASPFTTD